MIHSYIHKFKNGQILNLSVDLSQNQPMFKCDKKLDTENAEEYRFWIDNVVEPEVFKMLNYKQVVYLAKIGTSGNKQY